MTAFQRSGTLAVYLSVAIIMTALVLDGLDFQMLSLVTPTILTEWQVKGSEFAIALTAAVVGMAAGAPLGGWLGDRLGARRVLLGALICCGLTTFAAAAMHDVASMAITRVFAGLAFGAAAPNALALASRILPPSARATFASIAAMHTPLGGMVGAGLVLLVLPAFGWRACFIVAAVLTIAMTLALALRVPASMDAPSPTDARAVSDIEGRKPPHPGESGSTALFTRANLRMNLGAPLGYFAQAIIGFALLAWVPALLTMNGMTVAQAVTGSFVLNSMGIMGNLSAGPLIRWQGSRRALLIGVAAGIGLSILAPGMLGAYSAAPTPALRWMVYVTLGGLGMVAALCMSTSWALLACGYPEGSRGKGIGLGLMAGRTGAFLAVFVAGQFLGSGKGEGAIFAASIVVFLVIAVAAFIVDRHEPPRSRLSLAHA